MTKKKDKEAYGFRQKGHYFHWPSHAHSNSYKSMPLIATVVHILLSSMCEQECLQTCPRTWVHSPCSNTWGNGAHSSPCQGYVELGAGGKEIPAPIGTLTLHSPSHLCTLYYDFCFYDFIML